MNPICSFHMSGFCQLGEKCINKHEKPSLKSDVEAPSTSKQKVWKKTTIKPKTKTTTDLTKADENYHVLHTEIVFLKNENTKLNEKLNILKKNTTALQKQLTEEMDKSSKITDVLNEMVFEEEEYRCPVCRHIFIKPVLMNCGHMFCEWCIDKFLEKYNHCPTCRVLVINYTHCLNMDNFIEKQMEQMPENIRLSNKSLKENRAKEKQKSIQARADRMQLDLTTRILNTRRTSNM